MYFECASLSRIPCHCVYICRQRLPAMCLPRLVKSPNQFSMSEKHRVPVFDPESKDLRKVPLKKIDGEFILVTSLTYLRKSNLINHILASNYDKVEVSRWRRKFDVYESNDMEKDSSHSVVTGRSGDPKGKSFLARLSISRLGPTSNLKRFVSSRYRTLYIGAMPDL